MLKSKFITLTPFQISVLLGQAAPDEDNMVNYKAFSFKVKAMIDELFNLETMSQVAKYIQQGVVSEEMAEMPMITNLELFKLFKQFDKNLNGILELNEYIDCLKS